MANIVINEVSRNYSYAVGTSSFATVALPITACWGPGYFDPEGVPDPCDPGYTAEEKHSLMLDQTVWQRFAASQAGLESFISTYRGPVANYRLANDYSYQMALTLLSAGYDILVCRISPGQKAMGGFKYTEINPDGGGATQSVVQVTAKYPGTFGNNLRVDFKNIGYMYNSSQGNQWSYYWSMIVYIVDGSGKKTAVENIPLVFDIDNATDTIPHWREIESAYVDIQVHGEIPDFKEDATGKREPVKLIDLADTDPNSTKTFIILSGGNDVPSAPSTLTDDNARKLWYLRDAETLNALESVNLRYPSSGADGPLNTGFTYNDQERTYPAKIQEIVDDSSLRGSIDVAKCQAIMFREWVYTRAVGIPGRDGVEGVYDLLKDRLAYNPNRVISPGWDDQDFLYLLGLTDPAELCGNAIIATSPIHRKLMDVAYFSRCATGMLDIPRSLGKSYVYNDESENYLDWGYAQKLARYIPDNAAFTADVQLYHTHSALFTCWGRYPYSSLTRPALAPPAFLAIMIQRAMVLNQALQYEWILPTDRKQNLKISKMDYEIPQKLLNIWQTTEGVGVNCLTQIPGQNITLWGNSTLFEVPPATYQALANLSTRYLVNAVEDVIYKVGISITYQYNNSESYSAFVAGLLPILDTMKNAGAIQDYYTKMSLDINELDQVNANSVIGKVYLVINGVINDITSDLICLPPNTSLDQYRD